MFSCRVPLTVDAKLNHLPQSPRCPSEFHSLSSEQQLPSIWREPMQDTSSRSVSSKDEAKCSAASSARTPPAMPKPCQGSIGFIGLGHMGSAMAANLVGGGSAVIGYIREPERNAELQAG